MELTTFGAVIKFALEKEIEGVNLYQDLSKNDRYFACRDLFQTFVENGNMNMDRLEQVRRNITEMVLEPLTDFPTEGYVFNFVLDPNLRLNDLLGQLMALETTSEQFYLKCMEKLNFSEVTTLFKKLAKSKGKQREKLQAVTG